LTDRELLIKTVTIVEGLVKDVDIYKVIVPELAVTKDKVSRLEKIIYGAIMVIIAQLVGILFLFIRP
jgi:hypothetical protein